MALIECSECKEKISSKAHACPKCGNPLTDEEGQQEQQIVNAAADRPRKRGYLFFFYLVIVGTVIFFVGSTIIHGILSTAVTHYRTVDPNTIHADDEISMSPNAFGCEYLSKFAEAVQHYESRELSAWAAIVNDEPYCFSGISLKAGQKWTVVQVRGNLMQISQTTYEQYQTDPTRHGHSYWTQVAWGSKVSKNPPTAQVH